jgi:hypothetical protein
MIEILSVRGELDSLDELNRESFCAEHQDVPEARCSRWRLAFEKAAAKGDRNALVCANCAARWMPDIDINYAVRGWMMIVDEGRWYATLCGECAAGNPEPMRLPQIARLILQRRPRPPIGRFQANPLKSRGVDETQGKIDAVLARVGGRL